MATIDFPPLPLATHDHELRSLVKNILFGAAVSILSRTIVTSLSCIPDITFFSAQFALAIALIVLLFCAKTAASPTAFIDDIFARLFKLPREPYSFQSWQETMDIPLEDGTTFATAFFAIGYAIVFGIAITMDSTFSRRTTGVLCQFFVWVMVGAHMWEAGALLCFGARCALRCMGVWQMWQLIWRANFRGT